MKFAFCLFKYFPYGGLQRDLRRIAEECVRRGHSVDIYTMSWEGEKLPGIEVKIIPIARLANHRRAALFSEKLQSILKQAQYDLVVGFNKMPGLDAYYAADPCYVAKVYLKRHFWYRYTPRYRTYAKLEGAVFDQQSATEILLIAKREQNIFQQYYGTPDRRFYLLPPGIAHDRRAPANAAQIRTELRRRMQIPPDHSLILMVGSGFKTKGVDRALHALHSLPAEQRRKTHLYIVGQDNAKPFLALAKKLGITRHVNFLGGRDDVPRFLIAADLLLHPAYYENTGTVLLEALVAGLPVLTTDVCGYANYIEQSGAGVVLPSPFMQAELNQQLLIMLMSNYRATWQANALHYAQTADLYSMPSRAVDLLEKFYKEKYVDVQRGLDATVDNDAAKVNKLLKAAIVGGEAIADVIIAEPIDEMDLNQAALPQARSNSEPKAELIPRTTIALNKEFAKYANKPWYESCFVLADELATHWKGLDKFQEIFAQEGEIFREQKNRKTLRFTFNDRGYFVKLHNGVGWSEIFKNLLQGRLPVLGAQQEWRAILRLNDLGVPTARLVGFGSRGHNPARLQSFVVMEELHNTISLEDFCKDWPSQPPQPKLKWALIKEVARIARILHTHNINHRDFYLCHFLLDITNGIDQVFSTFIRLYLLDLHRVQQHKLPIAERWVVKDLAGLYFSSLEIGLTKRDVLRFIKCYRGIKLRESLKNDSKLWAKVNYRALALYGKEKQKLVESNNFTFPHSLVLQDDKRLLILEQPLRVVPKKRWVILGQWPNQQVVAKIFTNWRNAQRELLGYQALAEAYMTTPKLLYHGWSAGETFYVLLFSYIYPAKNYEEIFAEAGEHEYEKYLQELVLSVANLHRQGLQQTDLHLKNFMQSLDKTYVLDPGTIKAQEEEGGLSKRAGLRNLALLFAQLPAQCDYLSEKLYPAYTKARAIPFTILDVISLKRWIRYWRRHRLFAYRQKVMRNSTAIGHYQDWWRVAIWDRAYDSKTLQVLLRNPEVVLASPVAKMLKAGNTCTVVLIPMDGRLFVVKRYNITSFWYGVKRMFTPTRAAKSWRSAQVLKLANLPTPKPVAMMERRCGPLRHTAYFVSEYVEGIKLSEFFNKGLVVEEQKNVAEQVKALLRELGKIRFSHGDLKATNILLVDKKPVLIDLDAAQLHRCLWFWRRAARRDWKRLLKNWAGRAKVLALFEN